MSDYSDTTKWRVFEKFPELRQKQNRPQKVFKKKSSSSQIQSYHQQQQQDRQQQQQEKEKVVVVKEGNRNENRTKEEERRGGKEEFTILDKQVFEDMRLIRYIAKSELAKTNKQGVAVWIVPLSSFDKKILKAISVDEEKLEASKVRYNMMISDYDSTSLSIYPRDVLIQIIHMLEDKLNRRLPPLSHRP